MQTLMKTALRRQVKFTKLNGNTDLTKVTSMECFFIFVPLVQDLVEHKLTVEEVLEKQKKIKAVIL